MKKKFLALVTVFVIALMTVNFAGAQTGTITDVVVGNDDFDTLEAAVVAADLAGTLAGAGPFTVFAPTDAAFAALPAGTLDSLLADPSGALTNVLLYHVFIGQAVPASTVVGLDSITMANGGTITVSVVGGEVLLNGNVRVVTTDIQASNGIIHVIDAVLVPAAAPAAEPTAAPAAGNTIADIVVGSSDFETLEAAVVAAGLAETLAGTGPFTVFAPNDDAFAALPAGTLETLLNEPGLTTLTDILLYHVFIGQAVTLNDLLGLSSVTMANGGVITPSVTNQGYFLNGTVKIVTTDIQASNGIIHVIDAVLLPPAAPAADAPAAETPAPGRPGADAAGAGFGDVAIEVPNFTQADELIVNVPPYAFAEGVNGSYRITIYNANGDVYKTAQFWAASGSQFTFGDFSTAVRGGQYTLEIAPFTYERVFDSATGVTQFNYTPVAGATPLTSNVFTISAP